MIFIFLLLLYIQVCFPLELQFETEDNQAYKVEIPDESKDDQNFEIAIPNKYQSYPATNANRMLFDDNIWFRLSLVLILSRVENNEKKKFQNGKPAVI